MVLAVALQWIMQFYWSAMEEKTELTIGSSRILGEPDGEKEVMPKSIRPCQMELESVVCTREILTHTYESFCVSYCEVMF